MKRSSKVPNRKLMLCVGCNDITEPEINAMGLPSYLLMHNRWRIAYFPLRTFPAGQRDATPSSQDDRVVTCWHWTRRASWSLHYKEDRHVYVRPQSCCNTCTCVCIHHHAATPAHVSASTIMLQHLQMCLHPSSSTIMCLRPLSCWKSIRNPWPHCWHLSFESLRDEWKIGTFCCCKFATTLHN